MFANKVIKKDEISCSTEEPEMTLNHLHEATLGLYSLCLKMWCFNDPLRFKRRVKSRALTSCRSTALDGLLHLLLVLPAEVGVAGDVGRGLSGRSLPEAGEVVPVGDLPVKHGGLKDKQHTQHVYRGPVVISDKCEVILLWNRPVNKCKFACYVS